MESCTQTQSEMLTFPLQILWQSTVICGIYSVNQRP